MMAVKFNPLSGQFDLVDSKWKIDTTTYTDDFMIPKTTDLALGFQNEDALAKVNAYAAGGAMYLGASADGGISYFPNVAVGTGAVPLGAVTFQMRTRGTQASQTTALAGDYVGAMAFGVHSDNGTYTINASGSHLFSGLWSSVEDAPSGDTVGLKVYMGGYVSPLVTAHTLNSGASVEINEWQGDVDFIVNWDSGEAFSIDGATGDALFSQDIQADATLYVDGQFRNANEIRHYNNTSHQHLTARIYDDSNATGVLELRRNGTVQGDIRASSGDNGLELTSSGTRDIILQPGGSNAMTADGSTQNLTAHQNLTVNGTLTIGDYTLPGSDGSADQVLTTDGAGTVTWGDSAEDIWQSDASEGLVYLNSGYANYAIGSSLESGTDQSGEDTYFVGGIGTGTGSGGNLIFDVAPAGTTGSSPNSRETAFEVDGDNLDTTFSGKMFATSGIYGGLDDDDSLDIYASQATLGVYNQTDTINLHSRVVFDEDFTLENDNGGILKIARWQWFDVDGTVTLESDTSTLDMQILYGDPTVISSRSQVLSTVTMFDARPTIQPTASGTDSQTQWRMFFALPTYAPYLSTAVTAETTELVGYASSLLAAINASSHASAASVVQDAIGYTSIAAASDQATIDNVSLFRAQNSSTSGSGAITNQIGYLAEQLTTATNNTHFLIGTQATGDWGFYQSTTEDNYLAGKLVGAERPYIELTKSSATQNLNAGVAGTVTYISWDSQTNIDTDYFTHDTSTNNTRVAVDEDGRYEIKSVVPCTNGGSSRLTLRLEIRVNGTTTYKFGGTQSYSRGSAYNPTITPSVLTELDLSEDDYIEIGAVVEGRDHSSTSNTADADCQLIIRRVG